MAAFRVRRLSNRHKDIYDLAVKLPIEFLKCRAYGHDWGNHTKEPIENGAWRLFATCASCGAENWRDWSIYGERQDQGIYYPEGYVLAETGVLDTADRDIIRAIYLELVPLSK